MDKKIYPSKLNGEIRIPPSKSISHRSIICASLADGVSRIENMAYSDDIKATIEAMEALGASFEQEGNTLIVKGIKCDTERFRASEEKNSSVENVGTTLINCRESGSTIRFIIPLLTLFDREFEIKTEGKLLERPMSPYFDIFDREGILYRRSGKSLFIRGGKKIESRKIEIPGDISSQFISGMMFLLPLMEGDSEIIITGNTESKAYIDLTVECLEKFGVKVENTDYRVFRIRGNQKYRSKNFSVEGDYSQAAFFAVADALGNNVRMHGIEENSLQGDRKILDILKNFGAEVGFCESALEVKEDKRRAYSFDGSEIPDIVPVTALLASLSEGTTVIRNISRLKIKESDRLDATYTELEKLGADIKKGDDFLEIHGKKYLDGGVTVCSHKDHRIAMMLAIASTVCKEPITITDSESVSKSYPNFWEDFGRLGGIYECYMG